MFALALVALVLAAASVVIRLVNVVMNDRPLSAPRSHSHELEPRSARSYRVV
jgi:hypothetical protein